MAERTKKPVGANEIIGSLYSPDFSFDPSQNAKLTWDVQRRIIEGPNDPLPVPPPELRMYYGTESDQAFLDYGLRTYDAIRQIMNREGIQLVAGDSLLEWGCASGRVLRHFADETGICDVWGVDRDIPHLSWAKSNLSPPFKFVTCTAYPHLPFEDCTFRLCYGISVFTHVIHLIDMWLMEFRRILVPGGYALFTIQDEHSWQWILEHKDWNGFWSPFISKEELSNGMQHDIYALLSNENNDWDSVHTFFKTKWIRQEWGRYFEIVAIEPLAVDFQSIVVLRKPIAHPHV